MCASAIRLWQSLAALSLLSVLGCNGALADNRWRPDYVSGGFSHTADAREGVSIEAGWQVSNDWRFKTRLERGFYSRERTISLVEFSESFERTSIGLFVERKLPFAADFSVTAGFVHFDEASSWIANPTATAVYQLNSRYYSGLNLGEPKATVSYRDVVPYLGLSWSNLRSGKTGWGVGADVGFFFNLDPALRIKSDNPSNLPLLNADLQYEADRYVERLRADDDFLKDVAPRVGITAIYQF